MKLKSDFVTNSSSASFILYLESDTPNIEEFRRQFHNLLDAIEKIFPKLSESHFYEGLEIDNLTEYTYTVIEHVSMYNTYSDISSYMLKIILLNKIDPDILRSFGIKDVSFRIQDNH